MLREIYVLLESNVLYYRQFGTGISWDSLSSMLFSFINLLEKSVEQNIYTTNVVNYKVSYNFHKKLKLLFLFISDITDDDKLIEKQLNRAREEFTDLFPEDLITGAQSPEDFDAFHSISDLIHRELRPKIALVGFSGVGKTTTTRLIKADEIPTEHVPTMTGDISTIKIGKLHFHLWDFAGQEQFSFLWPKFVIGSDAVILITDSTLKNIDKSKFFLGLVKKEAPTARFAVLANKQDLPNVLTPEEIAEMLEVPKAYGMIAVDPNNRGKMISIIADVLEISSQVSPLIKPLIDRDKMVEEAQEALMAGNIEKAAGNFEAIAKFSMELGDDKIAKEFFERARAIRNAMAGGENGQIEAVNEEPVEKDPLPEEPKVEPEVLEEKPTMPDIPNLTMNEKKSTPVAPPTFNPPMNPVPEIKSEAPPTFNPPAEPAPVVKSEAPPTFNPPAEPAPVVKSEAPPTFNPPAKPAPEVKPSIEINISKPPKFKPIIKELKVDNDEITQSPQELGDIDQEKEARKQKMKAAIEDLKMSVESLENKLIEIKKEFSEKKLTEKNFKEKKLTLLEEKSQIRKEITELKLSLMDI